MYKVYSDDYLLYDDRIESLKISNAKVSLELNKTGAFEFTIYPNHPYYEMIRKLKSIITVYQDDYLLFRGRALNDEMGFYNEKQVVCEGQLAFLLDSMQRPKEFEGYLKDILAEVIAIHNSQAEASHQFTVGTVDGGDAYIAIVNEDYENTWEFINKQFIEAYGWYMQTRYEGGVHYIDFLDSFSAQSTQNIEFAKNLLDMKRIQRGEAIVTALIPLGAKLKDAEGNETGERLTIKSVNGGLDYIQNADAVAEYGFVCKSNTWDNVTDASMLLSIGQAHLANIVDSIDTFELSAADLATIDKTVESFRIGTNVRVTSNPHGINQSFLVNKLTINLLNPASNVLILGGKIEAFTVQSSQVKFIKGDQGIPGSNGKPGNDGKDAAIQSTTAPTDTSYMWLDISVSPAILKRYNSEKSAWEAVNDFSVGGRNLVLDSHRAISSKVYNIAQYELSEDWVEGDTYTVTIKGTNEAGNFGIWRDASSKQITAAVPYNEEKGLYIYTFVCPEPSTLTNQPTHRMAVWNTPNYQTTYNASIEWIKLEKGDKSTDWTPAPEDFTNALELLERNVYSEITSTDSAIRTAVAEGYYTKTDGEELGEQVSGIRTDFEQTSKAFTLRFTTIEGDVANIEKYVRLEDGNIILGESTNELTLRIENDRITFLDGRVEVAYFSNHKLHVTDGEFLNALRIGSFAFAPRQNGNLSFTKL